MRKRKQAEEHEPGHEPQDPVRGRRPDSGARPSHSRPSTAPPRAAAMPPAEACGRRARGRRESRAPPVRSAAGSSGGSAVSAARSPSASPRRSLRRRSLIVVVVLIIVGVVVVVVGLVVVGVDSAVRGRPTSRPPSDAPRAAVDGAPGPVAPRGCDHDDGREAAPNSCAVGMPEDASCPSAGTRSGSGRRRPDEQDRSRSPTRSRGRAVEPIQISDDAPSTPGQRFVQEQRVERVVLRRELGARYAATRWGQSIGMPQGRSSAGRTAPG